MTELRDKQAFYFDQAAELWRKLSGRELGCIDWAYLSAWYFGNVPLAAVLRGMELSFQRFKPKFRRDAIRRLEYCEPEIMTQADSMVEQIVDEHWQREREADQATVSMGLGEGED